MALILLVDDDPTLRAIATEMLRSSEHAIVEAGDGAQAMTLFDRLPFDLVILDLLMPHVDGLEMIAALRRQKSSVKILAISSGGLLDPSGLLKMATRLGADAALQKPLRLATFPLAVAALLERPEIAGMSIGIRRY